MTVPLWGSAPPLPPLVGPARADVCVVGLGSAGLTAIAELTRAGRSVVGIDAHGVGAGAAGRNGGFLLAGPAAFHHQLRAKIGAERARAFYELTLETRDALMADLAHAQPIGSLRRPHDDTERADLDAQLSALHSDGFEARWVGDGLLIPGDGVFDPARRCLDLAHGVGDRARLHGGSPALEVAPERVQTPHGEVRAEVVLVCLDGQLERLLPGLGEPGPDGRPAAKSWRLQMLATSPASEVSLDHAVYARRGYDYWQQRPDGRVALGGGRDVGGDDEATTEDAVTEAVQAHLEAVLRTTVGVSAPITHRWSGIVAYTEDDLPLADALPEVGEGVFVAGGYSGHGNVLSTQAGAALAALALGRATPALTGWLREVRKETCGD